MNSAPTEQKLKFNRGKRFFWQLIFFQVVEIFFFFFIIKSLKKVIFKEIGQLYYLYRHSLKNSGQLCQKDDSHRDSVKIKCRDCRSIPAKPTCIKKEKDFPRLPEI